MIQWCCVIPPYSTWMMNKLIIYFAFTNPRLTQTKARREKKKIKISAIVLWFLVERKSSSYKLVTPCGIRLLQHKKSIWIWLLWAKCQNTKHNGSRNVFRQYLHTHAEAVFRILHNKIVIIAGCLRWWKPFIFGLAQLFKWFFLFFFVTNILVHFLEECLQYSLRWMTYEPYSGGENQDDRIKGGNCWATKKTAAFRIYVFFYLLFAMRTTGLRIIKSKKAMLWIMHREKRLSCSEQQMKPLLFAWAH